MLAAVTGYVADLEAIRRQWRGICMNRLSESFFSEHVILVEGGTEVALLESVLGHERPLGVDGVTIISVGGDQVIPYHAILYSLGIKSTVVFDNDSDINGRMTQAGRNARDIRDAVSKVVKRNNAIQGYFGVQNIEDFPSGRLLDRLFAMPDTLEAALSTDWPEWVDNRSLVAESHPHLDGKNNYAYWLTTGMCETSPTGRLVELCNMLRPGRFPSEDREVIMIPDSAGEMEGTKS